jgi:hypothetical protein
MERHSHRNGRYSQRPGDFRISQAFEKSQREDFGGARREFGQSATEKLPQVTLIRTGIAAGG